MRSLLPALVLAAALLPAAALATALRAAPSPATSASGAGAGPTLTGAAGPNAYPSSLLVVSAASGLNLSRDEGKRFARPRGEPSRGSFYAIAADPVISGTAYATNGDVYQTANGGQDWRPLPVPTTLLGSGDVTALACGRDGALYAAGPAVLAYHKGHGWSAWGHGWPADARPTALLPTPHGLYAATGAHLFHLTDGQARWTAVAGWPGVVDAMTLGPDRATPYVAVQGQGMWRVAADGPHHLNADGLPDTTPIYALQSDPAGNDLYVAADPGLLRLHRPADPAPPPWQTALSVPDDTVVALRPWRQGMLALSSRRGLLYTGTRDERKGEILEWASARPRRIDVAPPLIAAVSGAEWRPIDTVPQQLPRAFTDAGPCALRGPTSSQSQSFDVCGPFNTFYIQYPGTDLFGAPLGLAHGLPGGGVEQDFEKVHLVWTRALGVRLAPVVSSLTRSRHFTRATLQQWQQGNAPYPNRYYVESRFYTFWRSYVYQPSGASIFGAPISQALTEQSTDGTGTPAPVQYFENARLEQESGGKIAVSFISGIPGQ